MVDRLAARRHLGDRAVVRAVAVPVGVAPLQQPRARDPGHFLGRIAEQALGALIPEDDAVVPIGDEDRVGRSRQGPGERYGSTNPRRMRRKGRTGSPDQKTSARGFFASAMRRLRTPVLLVSSVSKTAWTRTPDCRSNSLKTGSEKTWSTEV